MKDRFLLCLDCGEQFKFPARERVFYKRKKYQEPCHCRACREIRRKSKMLEERRMKKANWKGAKERK